LRSLYQPFTKPQSPVIHEIAPQGAVSFYNEFFLYKEKSFSYFCLIMTEENKQKQQILVPYDFSKATDNALLCATELAGLFKCEICLFHTINKKISKFYSGEKLSEEVVRKKLTIIAMNIIETHNIQTNVYFFKEEVDKVINKIYEQINAIAVVFGINAKKKPYHYFTPGDISTDYRNLRIPIITVHDELNNKSFFNNIILTLDFNRESKEKSAWAGHISTLNNTKITILTRHYNDSYFAAALRSNMALVKKLYDNLGVVYEIKNEPDIKCDIDKYAVDYAFYNKGEMLVVMATKEIAIDDLLFGLKEKKIINNKYKLPVMLINPRDDLYLPCGC